MPASQKHKTSGERKTVRTNLERLAQLNREVANAQTPEQVSHAIAACASALTGADFAVVLVRDDKNTFLRLIGTSEGHLPTDRMFQSSQQVTAWISHRL